MTYVEPLPFGHEYISASVDKAHFLWMNESLRGLTPHNQK